ncbi:putative short-chain dehydrogenase/reductase [Frankia sp. Hr75.2]|nr:putative short-chain dehydrogenase/reductase [Frankia sp. Hr75.2]
MVTGAGHGIGLAAAQTLAAAGYRIVAVDRDRGALEKAELPAGSVLLEHDIAEVESDVLAGLDDDLRIEALVNNVGVMDGRSFLELPVADAARVLHTNIVGSWAVTRTVVDHMLARQVRGAIVFNLSLHTSRVRMCPDYSMSKAALAMLVQELAVELGPAGIRVNSVSPGAIDTGHGPAEDAEAHRARSAALVALGRVGEPDDVAKVIAWLCSEQAGYVTGTDIRVDGGLFHYNWLHHLYGSAATERHRTQ